MANEKKISRTLIIGYNYDVLRKNGNTMEIVGTIQNSKVIRSMKEQKEVLLANKFLESDALVMTTTETRLYEMSESDFIKYATVVKVDEPKEETKEPQDEPATPQL